MISYLVDTNIISETAPHRPLRSGPLLAWLDARTDALFLSAVTIAEIEAGIAYAERQHATRKAARLAQWLEAVLHLYSHRVLAFDVPAARMVGQLSGQARAGGASPGFADVAIAATAVVHRLTVLTRNLRHFAPLGVTAIDPFAGLPA